jgi:hypothetical protein
MFCFEVVYGFIFTRSLHSLRHCRFASLHGVFVFAFVLHFRWIAPVHPLQRHDTDDAADIRELLAALSGISRASRLHFVSIQRFLPCFLPAISAGNLHKLQILQLV